MVDGRRLVGLSDSQLELVLEYAAEVDWSARKGFLVAVVTHLARSGEPDDRPCWRRAGRPWWPRSLSIPVRVDLNDVTGVC